MRARMLTSMLILGMVLIAQSARAQCADWQIGPLDDGTAPNGADGAVEALTTWDPDGAGPLPAMLVAGGYFTSIEGTPVYHIAADPERPAVSVALGSVREPWSAGR
jgi:hypothetical protein